MARNLTIQKLGEYIQDEDICKRIENSIYYYAMEKSKERCIKQDLADKYFRRIYVNKLHQIYTNLNPDSYVKNSYFLDRILSEEINPSTVAFLSPQELNYEHWKEMIDKQSATDDFKTNAISGGTRTTEFTCGRCKKNDTSYIIAQLRSCDEPASYLINCLNCGKKWRIN